MDDLLVSAVDLLLRAGWRGALAAILLVALAVAVKHGGPAAVAAVGKALADAKPQAVADENGAQPSGQPLDVDEEHPGGDTPSGA